MRMLIHGNPCFLLLIETAAPPLFHTVRGNHPYGGEMHQKIHTNSTGHALNECSFSLRFCWKQTPSRSFAFCCHHSVTMSRFQGDQYQWWACNLTGFGVNQYPSICYEALFISMELLNCPLLLNGFLEWLPWNYIMDYINLPLQMNGSPNLTE